MSRLALLAALALLLTASASAQAAAPAPAQAQAQTQDPDHIDPATLVPPCRMKKTLPCATSAPKVLSQPDPDYTKEAHDKKIQGVVVLYLVVGTDGRAHDVRVARSLGYGLDEQAVKVMKKWKFRPALTDKGVPVPVAINIEIDFHLY